MDRNPSLDGEARKLAQKIAPVLKEQAGATIFYSKLMAPLGLTTDDPVHRTLIANALAHVSRESWDKDGFMLSACVVSMETTTPSNGFYTLAVDLGAMEYGADKDKFWIGQIKKITAKYGSG